MPGLLIHGARQVLTLRGPTSPRRGTALRNLSIIEDGSILIEDGKIRDVGPTRRIENLAVARAASQISARGRVVMPGFVDCLVRLIGGPEGALDDADSGAAVRSIRQTPAWRLSADASSTLKRCLRYGTTTAEVKSWAGLDEGSDLKVLRIVAELAKLQPIELISTYSVGAATPEEFKGRVDAYILHLITRVLPRVRAKGLASFVAVSPDASAIGDRLADATVEAAARLGMPVKFCGESGVVERSAITAEGLERITPREIERLANSGTIGVLMPSRSFHSPGRGYAPARDMIAGGVPIALASGYDRVSNPCFSMPITIELACRNFPMAPSEAIVAATLNAAYAVGRGATTGSIEPGKNADLLILETSDYRDLGYETGVNPVDITIVRGEVACRNSVAYGREAAAG